MSRELPSPVTVRQLATPLIVVAVAIALIVAAGMFWAARRGDAQALVAQTELVKNNLRRQQDRLRTEVSAELIWDEALTNIGTNRNLAWLDYNVADWFAEAHSIDQVMVVDGNDRPFYFAIGGKRADLSVWQSQRFDVGAILQQIRLAERTPELEADTAVSFSRPIDQVELIGLPQGAAFIVATLVQPDLAIDAANSAPKPVVFSLQWIDAAVIAELTEVLRLQDARVEAEPSSDRAGRVALQDAAGHNLVWISWRAERPGAELLRNSAPFVVLGYAAFLALVALLLARTWRMGGIIKASEAQALFLAHHDALTGLPNRLALSERTDAAIAACGVGGESLAVLCLDLDRFKDINDTFGHAIGDQLLVELANRLRPILPPTATLARLGGDEFAVLLPTTPSHDAIEQLAAALLAAICLSSSIAGIDHQVSASIGIAVADGSVSREELMRRADVALYRAKAAGRACARFHDHQMDAVITSRHALALELRQALTGGQLLVHYQPQLRCIDRVMIGVEALIRWPHPTRGLIAPQLLISIAEESGLIRDLGDWVLRQALADASRWPGLNVAVNVSPEQFKAAGFAERLLDLSKQAAVVPHRIELEITESLLLDPSQETERTLQALRSIGAQLVLDDFGTGYSSLGYLRRYRLDKLKIDRTFVQCAEGDEGGQAILGAVAGIARSLHLEFTAEGVETEEQHAAVAALGCDSAQGFLYSPALSAAQIDTLCGLSSAALPMLTFEDPAQASLA